MEKSRDWRAAEIVHDDHYRAQRLRGGNSRSDAGVPDRAAIRAVAERGGGGWNSNASLNDYLQRWPVSKRVNSSKADAGMRRRC